MTQLSAKDARLLDQLRRVHSKGAGSVDLDQISDLLAWPAVAQRIESDSPSRRREALQSALEAAQERLRTRDQEVCPYVFGFGAAEAMGVTARNSQVAEIVHVEWDKYRHAPLTEFLRRVLQALSEIGAPSATSQQTAAGFRLVKYEVICTLPTAENPEMGFETRRAIRPTRDGVTRWFTDWWHESAALTGEPRVQLSGPGRLTSLVTARRDQSGQGYAGEYVVDFPQALPRDRDTEFTLHYRAPIDFESYLTASGPYYRGLRPPHPIEKMRLTVHFDPRHLPQRIAVQTGVPLAQYATYDIQGSLDRELETETSLSWAWTDVQPGRWYGLVWSS